MENLLLLLNKISQISPLGVFNQEVVVVQNAGMQHWLNLAIAKERGISMNMRYALPAQYLWQLIRTLASDEKVPEQSPYSREVLTWRIYALLATEIVTQDKDFSPATRYWNGAESSEISTSSQDKLKRYQLAGQMADLFEQYLIFRPQWLDSWQKGDITENLANDNLWQAKLWQLLIKQQAYNPVELLQDAIANIEFKLAQDPLLLPKRLSFFGINSMAPMWLTFLNAISEYIEVDFFHLNPCFSYWGDIISQKQAMKKLAHWADGVHDEHLFVGNPLLANFGQQGREFLALLQDYSTVNVDLFVKAAHDNVNSSEQKNECILHRLQNDILTLEDATQTPTPLIDNSITIASCHSALREVQALHDYLLHRFNDSANHGDNSLEKLTPKDVLVMCPQIEQYAPYVNAVFTRGWQELNDEVPPLPCSIADRSAKDSDPLIAGFSELLTLPDSRFQVSNLLSFIRLPAVANKFAINEEDSEKISLWLQQATVHWGLDQAHKQKLLGESANANFTWQQGLSRLLRGFAFADVDSIYQDQLLLAAVEGDDAVLLGQLILFIEQLQVFAKQLTTARTAKEWQSFLLQQLELLFATNNQFTQNSSQSHQSINNINNQQLNSQIENSLAIIEQAIAALVEYCQHAHFEEKIELAIVVDFLNNHFSQGDSSRQFMIGQVTFCSMLPMRSIPFKIIAVLGLNDGEFPRQRQALGFDLMAKSPAQLGDRSRRGDDRYLFLEALISARQALYLSYQGRNIKNNNEKQPSLVLKELMDYLSQGYGWCFNDNTKHDGVFQENQLQQLPMQPFSESNYLSSNSLLSTKPSFDANWLKLAQHKQSSMTNSHLIVSDEKIEVSVVSLADLIRFYQHPSKMFAQNVLNLYLDDRTVNLDDVEPFSADFLESYLLKQSLLSASLLEDQSQVENSIEQTLKTAQLSGKFPDLPNTTTQFETWLADTKDFSEAIINQGCENPQFIDCAIHLPVESSNQSSTQTNNDGSVVTQQLTLTVTAKVPVKLTKQGAQVVFYRSSTAKVKDLLTLYLHQLFVQVWQQQNSTKEHYHQQVLSQVESSCGFYFNTKEQAVEQLQITHVEHAQTQLSQFLHFYFQGQQQALLLNASLVNLVFKTSYGKPVEMTQTSFENFWTETGGTGKNTFAAFGEDPYIQYFWPQCPDIFDYLSPITNLYQGMYQSVTKVDNKDVRP